MKAPRIKSTAVLIGFDPDGKSVYGEILDLSDYYDGDHIWDSAQDVKKLKLRHVKGYLFDAEGNLDQEFESNFDLNSGIYKSGYVRLADGTEQVDREDAS